MGETRKRYVNSDGQDGSRGGKGKDNYAVIVRHAYKHYGPKRHRNQVMEDLNMNVPAGSIYGLLGASGCGKTTLLTCIVGRKVFDKGEVWVLGGKPGSRRSGVPGKRVGYMPQEIALYQEFSIKETMMYFGWIYDMPSKDIKNVIKFLIEFLDLPTQNRLVKNLSGGQQRRVSFAIALVHNPELLILDEPTVGVDPLLRHKIWNYLVDLSKSGNKTIILTTHYIEEARQAHKIGLMRGGKLLAEESPAALLQMNKSSTLEEVFLKLSRNQASPEILSFILLALNCIISIADLNLPTAQVNTAADEIIRVESGTSTSNRTVETIAGWTACSYITTCGKSKALLQKNFLRMFRNFGMLMFIFILPIVQINLFCLTFGKDPKGLEIAIVNHEVEYMDKKNQNCKFDKGCKFVNLSCRYLDYLNTAIIDKIYFQSVDEATEDVKKGDSWGVIYFSKNFSLAFQGRMAPSIVLTDNDMLDMSEIQIWLDMSNQQIGTTIQKELQLAYMDFAEGLLTDCSMNPAIARSPITFKDPIYGTKNTTFTDFVAPGVVLTIVFFLAVALTSTSLITERTEGLLDRSWVAGVTPAEVLFSHVIGQFIVMCFQTAIVLIFLLLVFKVECKGSMFWVITLPVLQGFCGMCYGFFISAICDTELNAMQLALGSFYPMLLLSGVLWPTEGMPVFMECISLYLPLTRATSALRAVMTRGWSISMSEVYGGFIASILWTIFFLIVSLLLIKYRKG